MVSDEEIKKVGLAVQAGLQVLSEAMLEGSEVARQEFVKFALNMKSTFEPLLQKPN